MFTATRLSKKTFLAAAAFGIASAFSVPANAYTVTSGAATYKDGVWYFNVDGESVTYEPTFVATDGFLDVVKTGNGDVKASIGTSGTMLYNLHYAWWDPNLSNTGLVEYTVHRNPTTGAVIVNDDNYALLSYLGSNSLSLLEWESGEVRVEEGILELSGFVNAWFDFGTSYKDSVGAKMTGATRVTVNNGAVLDLSGNNNSDANSVFGSMGGKSFLTYFQFLHNLQAGDNGNAATSTLRLGSSPSLHVNIHIDGWNENTRSERRDGTYLDNSLAFGGSIGVLQGSAAVYKTGAGDLVLLNTSSGFDGELYAAGGELTLAANNSAGLGVYTFNDVNGNAVWKAKISSAFSAVESVNIAGTYRDNGSNGESRNGAAIRYAEQVSISQSVSSEEEVTHYAIKEAYFTSPDAGTLVIAENQQIKNFQSYFNAGYSVSSLTTAKAAVLKAGNAAVEYTRTGITSESIVATAPIIAGTGIGSKLVIPGGNYKLVDGNWELQTNAETGEMLGGVLLINQEAGMGGIYEGAIVGCRVSIYDRAAFNANTEAKASSEDAGTASQRLKEVLVQSTAIQTALGLTDDEMATLNIQSDGSFALDNEVAWKVVNYYKAQTTSNSSDELFYIDYQADANVTGGILALDGAGDLALLLEQSNFSGIHIAETRTGKTVVNIATLNALSGSVSALGGNVSVVATQKDTLKTKLSFAEGTKLVFTTGETISTVVREAYQFSEAKVPGWDVITPGGNTILVGDVRKSVVAFDIVQDLVYGDVYVERGVDLDLAGTETIFPNANSLTLWGGATTRSGDAALAASSLTLKGDPNDDGITYVQTIKNLTGDSSAIIDMGSGVLIADITDNSTDSEYSKLTRGTFDGLLRGEGSLVKGGSATLTLGGGEHNIFTGTTEVGAGTLNISRTNGLTRSSALILDAGTTATMVDGQTLRNLYGAANSTMRVGEFVTNELGVQVFVAGALTVGSDAKYANGENRPLFVNNLGSSTSADSAVSYDNSFARFEGNYDREGNLVVTDASKFKDQTQAAATSAYLTATAKLAYSGYDAGTLAQFVGVTNFDGTELLTQENYDAIVAYAKTQNTTSSVTYADVPVELSSATLLTTLADIYQGLADAQFYLDNITKKNGYYDPATLLRGFFPSEAKYQQYIAENGLTAPTTTESPNQQIETNKQLFQKIAASYQELSEVANDEALKAAFSTEDAVRAKFNADFGSLKNLGGTAFYNEADYNETISEYGVALDKQTTLTAELNALEAKLVVGNLTEAQEAELEAQIEAAETALATVEAQISLLVGKLVTDYNLLASAKSTLEAKQLFSGIAIAGAFASDVTVGGDLVNSAWTDNLEYAGALTVSSLTKTGDNTLTLTGTLSAEKLVVDGGELRVNFETLPEKLTGGISVARDADFAVNVADASAVETFDYELSGYGNFIKSGDGKLILGDNVLYTGTTTIEGGVLQMTLRNPRSYTDANGVRQFLAAQDNIFITGEGAGLILNQKDKDEDVVWTKNLTSSADNVFVQKIGAGALEISGATTLTGENSALTVAAGTLKLSGEFAIGENALITIDSGATLSIASLGGDTSSVAIRGAGKLGIDGDVALNGSGISAVESIPANGNGLTWDAFYGTVAVNSGTLKLCGESLFDYARGMVVAKGATLSVAENSTQNLKGLEGAGTLALAGTLSLANNDGARLNWDWTSTKSYIFEEGDLFEAPVFTGAVTGAGTLSVSGKGMMGFMGDLSANVSVVGGGQLILDAAKANGLQDAGKKLLVSGSATYNYDANGRLIVAEQGTNYSSGIAATDANAFYAKSGEAYYAPRNLTAYYTDINGNKISVPAANVIKDENGKLIDSESRREVTVSATQWDLVSADGTLSANWAIYDASGNLVDLTKTTTALVWDSAQQKFVLGTYETKTKETLDYVAGYQALARQENEDGSVSLVVADLEKTSSETYVSELLLSASEGTESDDVKLNSGLITFESGGLLGKVGDGKLTIAGSDLRAENGCGGVNVYEGELVLSGGEWVLSDANAASVALGATLTVELSGENAPDFTSVYGSGTLKLTGAGSVSIGQTPNTLGVLPVYSADGKFFNGITSFEGAFTVSISDVEMSAINTSADVVLTLNEGVTLIQTQNSAIAGTLVIEGDVLVKGLSSAAGTATSSEARRLTVDTYTLQGDGALTLQNVGFAYSASKTAEIIIDKDSVANTFYFTLGENETVNNGTLIDLSSNSKPGTGSSGPKLAEISMIMSGADTASWTISGGQLSGLGNLSDPLKKDEVFGISDAVYKQLASQNGTLYVGVEAGTLVVTNLGDYTGTTANGVNIDLLTLRSNVGATAGTLEFGADAVTTLRTSAAASSVMQTLSETVRGGGNVVFSNPNGTQVTASQEYLGATTVSGKLQLSGNGQNFNSSDFTVQSGGALIGGLNLLGRDISVTGSMLRNMSDTGAAGTTTLKLALSDPRLPTTITLQFEVDSLGRVTSPKIYAQSVLDQYGISVEVPTDEKTGEYISVNKDTGTLEIKITDAAYGETYSVNLPVDVNAFPSKVNQTAAYSASDIAVATTFTLESGATWTANFANGDGVAATNAVLNGTILLEGLSDVSALGKDVALVAADSISSSNNKLGSEAVAQALRKGKLEENVMVYTDADGVVNVRVLNDDFASVGVDYNDGISTSFLNALSEIAGAKGTNAIVNGVLNADTTAATAQMKDLFFALNSLSASQLAQEVEKLSPNLFASMLAMPVTAFNGDIARLHGRLDQRRYDGANPLRESGEAEFFAYTQGDFAENDSASDTPTFDYNLYGVTAGYDWKPNYETTLGVALGYTYGKATAHHGGGKVEMDDMRITAFGSRLFGNVYVDAGVQAGFAMFDTRRNTVAGHANGDTDSIYAGTFITVGTVYALSQNKKDGSGVYFTPSIGLSYLHTEIDGFSEDGTAGLKIDDTDGDSLRARVAAGLQWVFPVETWEMRLGAELAYTHDFLGEELDTDASFVAGGSKFGTSGKALPTDIFSFGPTLDILLSERTSLYIGYGIEIDTDAGVSQNVNAGFRHRF